MVNFLCKFEIDDQPSHLVLHATEYDVCERCFVDFAVDGRSDGALPQTRRVGAR